MGEIADDHQGIILDEIDEFHCDPDKFPFSHEIWIGKQIEERAKRAQTNRQPRIKRNEDEPPF